MLLYAAIGAFGLLFLLAMLFLGDIFHAETAGKLHDHVYAAGGARDPAELYMAFRGRLPSPERLLKNRGLSEATS